MKAWLGTLSDLQAYVKQHHTTGVQWNKNGCDVSAAGAGGSPAKCPQAGPPGPPPAPGPPPPPVIAPSGGGSGGGTDEGRSALFSALSKGEDVTKGLKKVSHNMPYIALVSIVLYCRSFGMTVSIAFDKRSSLPSLQ